VTGDSFEAVKRGNQYLHTECLRQIVLMFQFNSNKAISHYLMRYLYLRPRQM